MRIFFSFFLFLFCLNLLGQERHVSEKRALQLMGTDFEITIVAKEHATAKKHIETAISEIKRIEKIISSWDDDSETSKINKNRCASIVKEV